MGKLTSVAKDVKKLYPSYIAATLQTVWQFLKWLSYNMTQ